MADQALAWKIHLSDESDPMDSRRGQLLLLKPNTLNLTLKNDPTLHINKELAKRKPNIKTKFIQQIFHKSLTQQRERSHSLGELPTDLFKPASNAPKNRKRNR